MPASERKCASCGATRRLAGHAEELTGHGDGLCAACLLVLALGRADEQLDEGVPAPPAYRVLAVLAGGEGRTTYLGEEEGSHAPVAIHVVTAAAVAGMTRGLFDARLAELMRLRHRVIVPVLGGRVTASGDYCLVSRYVPGRTADAWAATARPSAREILHLFDPLCDAVACAHHQHVVHGRLAPSRVLVFEDEGGREARLTGYGVCDTAAREGDDVEGLGRVLEALARHSAETARLFAPVVARAVAAHGDRYASIAELRGVAGTLADAPVQPWPDIGPRQSSFPRP